MCVCVYILKKKANKLYKQTRLKTKPKNTKKTKQNNVLTLQVSESEEQCDDGNASFSFVGRSRRDPRRTHFLLHRRHHHYQTPFFLLYE